MLYAQWRFRGLCPWEVYNGRRKPDGWTSSGLEGLLTAFAWYAADRERDVVDAIEAFGRG